jgi:hypothetical protein
MELKTSITMELKNGSVTQNIDHSSITPQLKIQYPNFTDNIIIWTLDATTFDGKKIKVEINKSTNTITVDIKESI